MEKEIKLYSSVDSEFNLDLDKLRKMVYNLKEESNESIRFEKNINNLKNLIAQHILLEQKLLKKMYFQKGYTEVKIEFLTHETESLRKIHDDYVKGEFLYYRTDKKLLPELNSNLKIIKK